MIKIIMLLAFLMILGVNAVVAEETNAKLQELQQVPDDTHLLNETGFALYKAGRYAEAEPLYQRSLAIYEKALGKDHPNVATSLYNLARLYELQGKYTEAEPLYQRSLAIREQALGKNHPDVAISLNNLALLYKSQGKYTEAEPLLQRSLAIKEQALGKDHPAVATSLNNLAELYNAQGKYTEAEPLLKRGLAIWEKALGKDHPNIATSLNNLAGLYYAQGKYTEAESLFQRSLAMREQALGKVHPDVAQSLNNLAGIYTAQGKYTEAKSLYQRSLEIREQALGKEHPDVATSLNSMAELYRVQGKYTEAEPLYQRSLAIREQALGKNHPDVAISLNNLALLYKSQGKYTEAEPLYQRSLAIKEQALGKDHPSVASSLNNLAALYTAQAKYTEAEHLFQRSLAIDEKALGKDHPDVATDLNNLAALYDDQGKYSEAEPLYQRSLAISEKALSKDHPDVAQRLNNLAVLYCAQGKYTEAEPLYQRSLAIREKALGKVHPDVAQSLNTLAALYYSQGKYTEAEPLYQRSLAIYEKALGKVHPDVAMSLNNLAVLYGDQGKYTEAEPLFQRSLAIREQALGKVHPDVAMSLNNLAVIYTAQGKYIEAEPLFQRSLAIREQALGKVHPDVVMSLDNLAVLYIAENKYDLASPLFQRSLRITNQNLERWLWGAGEKTRQSYLQKEEVGRNAYLTFYSLRNTPEEAFYFSLSRKGLLLRIASEVSSLSNQSSDSAIQKQVEDFKALRAQIANLLFSKNVDKKTIEALEEKSNELERQLSSQVSSFKRNKTEVIPKDVLAKLKSDESLVDFLVYTEIDLKTQKPKTEQVIALIADQKNGIKLIKLGELVPIVTAINNYQTAIVPSKDNEKTREQALKQAAQTLYTQLWQPLSSFLQNKTQVYIIPDGVLHLLPFKALQDTEGHYLAEKLQLITLSSARDLVLPPLEATATIPAIFAPHVFGDAKETHAQVTTIGVEQKNLYFPPLPYTLDEAQQIDKLFFKIVPNSRPKLFLNENATELAVSNLTAPKILHLATHGFYLEEQKLPAKDLEWGLMRNLDEPLPFTQLDNPLTRSGLAFAGANLGVKGVKQASDTDGILTALEVLNLKLEGTDLVTLSACDTSKGDIKIGEGVYSLNRAFQEAGAKAVLSTLWVVDDEATGLFMQKFYERFLSGKPAQIAIQETQSEFMTDKKYHNPYYWAGFVMMGKD